MASKHFITFIVMAAMAISQANAQLGLAVLNGLLDAFHIHGNVNCDFGGRNTNEKVAAFPNAQMQLLCGANELSKGRTNDSGAFLFEVSHISLNSNFPSLDGCNVLVNTPLSKCNNKYPPIGNLVSSLQFVGVNRVGPQNIAHIISSGFHYVNSTQ